MSTYGSLYESQVQFYDVDRNTPSQPQPFTPSPPQLPGDTVCYSAEVRYGTTVGQSFEAHPTGYVLHTPLSVGHAPTGSHATESYGKQQWPPYPETHQATAGHAAAFYEPPYTSPYLEVSQVTSLSDTPTGSSSVADSTRYVPTTYPYNMQGIEYPPHFEVAAGLAYANLDYDPGPATGTTNMWSQAAAADGGPITGHDGDALIPESGYDAPSYSFGNVASQVQEILNKPMISSVTGLHGTTYRAPVDDYPTRPPTRRGNRFSPYQHQARVGDPHVDSGRVPTGSAQATSRVHRLGPSPKYNTCKSYTNLPVYNGRSQIGQGSASKIDTPLTQVQAESSTGSAWATITNASYMDQQGLTSLKSERDRGTDQPIASTPIRQSNPRKTRICANRSCGKKLLARKDSLKRHAVANIACLVANWKALTDNPEVLWLTRGRTSVPTSFSHEFTALVAEYEQTGDETKLRAFAKRHLPKYRK